MIRSELADTDKLLPSLCDVVRAGVSGNHLLTATRKPPRPTCGLSSRSAALNGTMILFIDVVEVLTGLPN
jgi:hypothetical protein